MQRSLFYFVHLVANPSAYTYHRNFLVRHHLVRVGALEAMHVKASRGRLGKNIFLNSSNSCWNKGEGLSCLTSTKYTRTRCFQIQRCNSMLSRRLQIQNLKNFVDITSAPSRWSQSSNVQRSTIFPPHLITYFSTNIGGRLVGRETFSLYNYPPSGQSLRPQKTSV